MLKCMIVCMIASRRSPWTVLMNRCVKFCLKIFSSWEIISQNLWGFLLWDFHILLECWSSKCASALVNHQRVLYVSVVLPVASVTVCHDEIHSEGLRLKSTSNMWMFVLCTIRCGTWGLRLRYIASVVIPTPSPRSDARQHNRRSVSLWACWR